MRLKTAALCSAVALSACLYDSSTRSPAADALPKRAEGGRVQSPSTTSAAVEEPSTSRLMITPKPSPSPPRSEGVLAKPSKPTGSAALGSSIGNAHGVGGLGTKGAGIGGGGLAMGSGSAGPRGKSAASPHPVATEPESNAEAYGEYGINTWVNTAADKLSTFSVDVDTASYTIARRKILEGTLPPPSSVRVEEFLNYFRYRYNEPNGGPLSVTMDAAPSPYSPGKHLLRVGVQGRVLSLQERKHAHLTFLVDVSGSMESPDKLPLAKRALRMLVDSLRDGDSVALVTYAGSTRVVLKPTGLEKKAVIHAAIEDLTAGGSTAMASGIELAYAQAAKTLSSDSISRVIILSDGDANVGPTGHDKVLRLIRHHVKEGITVSTLGFGMGNYKDELMEQFANKGNGNHAYVDSLFEARRIFHEQLGATLEVIAQDVKLQVEFNPEMVKGYRLVGYENRDIADKDFRNDHVDAGEIGSGHSVTALYEVELKTGAGDSLATVRLRAKPPKGTTASEQAFVFSKDQLASSFENASADFRFATAVMGAAEKFRQSPHARTWSFENIISIAKRASEPSNPERQEFINLLTHAQKRLGALTQRE
jgi:Ca-activated chloride channel family protein